MEQKVIWTIGHSTNTLEEFIAKLKSFNIELLVDIRSFPGSRRFPHFNKEALKISLPENNIEYLHLVQLGGRRKPRSDSHNTGWRVEAFRGYADYMETEDFRNTIKELEERAAEKRTAYMCSEAVWWRCHRRMIADAETARGIPVKHVISERNAPRHVLSAFAVVKKRGGCAPTITYPQQRT